MNQWEIFTWNFPAAGPHPAVIISAPGRVAHKPVVNVLLCSTARAARPAAVNEVLLDRADGLDWETLVRCDLIYAVDKTELRQRRGTVTASRRRAIVQTILQTFAWAGL